MAAGAFGLDGLEPAQVRRPGTAREVEDLVREARARGWAMVVWGGGQEVHVGNALERYDLAVATGGLAGILPDYSPADLVVTAGAGTALAALQAFLGEHGQRLPLDGLPGTTLGGLVAGSVPQRAAMSRGRPRDWLVGLRAVTGEGRTIRAGGRVVKNVAGYDLCKLLAGSRGTLAVLTEVSFKVAPLPEATVEGTASCDDFPAVEAVRRSAMAAGAAWLELEAAGTLRVAIGFEGYAADVEAQTGHLAAALRREGVAQPDWRSVADAGSGTGMGAAPSAGKAGAGEASPGTSMSTGTVFRIGALPDRLAGILARGRFGRAVAQLGSGTATIAGEAGDLAAWRVAAEGAGGWALLERGDKAGLDVFGPARPEWELGHALKRVFDPDRVLSPGRGPGRV